MLLSQTSESKVNQLGKEKVLELWRRTINLLRVCVVMLHQFQNVNRKIEMFGRQLIGVHKQLEAVHNDQVRVHWLII